LQQGLGSTALRLCCQTVTYFKFGSPGIRNLCHALRQRWFLNKNAVLLAQPPVRLCEVCLWSHDSLRYVARLPLFDSNELGTVRKHHLGLCLDLSYETAPWHTVHGRWTAAAYCCRAYCNVARQHLNGWLPLALHHSFNHVSPLSFFPLALQPVCLLRCTAGGALAFLTKGLLSRLIADELHMW
jgi:hypothetical protein